MQRCTAPHRINIAALYNYSGTGSCLHDYALPHGTKERRRQQHYTGAAASSATRLSLQDCMVMQRHTTCINRPEQQQLPVLQVLVCRDTRRCITHRLTAARHGVHWASSSDVESGYSRIWNAVTIATAVVEARLCHHKKLMSTVHQTVTCGELNPGLFCRKTAHWPLTHLTMQGKVWSQMSHLLFCWITCNI